MNQFETPQRPTLRAPKKRQQSKPPKKPKLSAHEQMLESIKGKRVRVVLNNQDETLVKGKLIDYDKYALVIECTQDQEVLTIAFFKHSILAFSADGE